MADGFEFVIDKEQPMPTREEVIEIKNRLLRWARNDAAFHSAIVCEERLKFEKKYAHWKELEKAEAEGRLVVLPFRPNEDVYDYSEFFNGTPFAEYYKLRDSFIGVGVSADGKTTFEYDCFIIDPEQIGKTVFLTREEAEATLKGESNG